MSSLAAFFFLVDASASVDLRFFPDAGAALAAGGSPAAPAPPVVPDVSAISAR